MKISVIIPVHNEDQYIGACLDSLKKQMVEPEEIIVVDNNCTDSTIAIVRKYPVRVIREKQQGMIHSRNAGFNAAVGDIIARCDADTVLPADWIKRIKENFANDKIAALSGPVYFHELPIVKEFDLPAIMYAKVMKTIQNHETLLGPNMALTQTIWQKVRDEVCLDETKVHEDIDLAIHIKKYGRIKFDPDLSVWSSSRRIRHNPLSFFVEYPIRVVKTLHHH